MTTSRTYFNESWLYEMPTRSNPIDSFSVLNRIIPERIEIGLKVKQITNTLKKIEGGQTVFYWYEIDGKIALAIELRVRAESLIVGLVGKNPEFKGKPPYASDMYNEILKDNILSLRFMSDELLTDDGYAVWKKLFQQGHKISVYDNEHPGQTFRTFDNEHEMEQYFSDLPSGKRYQYILSETGLMLGETVNFFGTRRYRELLGLGTED